MLSDVIKRNRHVYIVLGLLSVRESLMISKEMVILFVFFFLSDTFACCSDPEFSNYGEFPSPLVGCKGRLYETSTQYNNISPRGQELWTIHDDIIDPKDQYKALNIHACRVLPHGHSFKFLITKFEVHPDNEYIDRSLYTFLSCLVVDPILFNSEVIYAWVHKTNDENLLKILKESYLFKKSKIKLEDSDGKSIKKPKDMIQLKVSVNELTMVEINSWLQAQLAS